MKSIEDYKENILKEGLRRAVHYSSASRVLYDDLSNYVLNKKFVKCRDIIRLTKNMHKGERCFLIATGPSINKVNLDLLKNEVVVGVNTAYNLGVDFDYFVVSDRIIWDVYKDEIMDIDAYLILGYVASRHYLNKNNCPEDILIFKGKKTISENNCFPKDMSEYIYVDAPTVVYIALQILYYLGFKEVYLLGCDCNYKIGHFDDLTFVETDKIHKDDKKEIEFWDKVFRGYEVCKKEYENDNRKIYNCTIGGKLEIFERKKLEEVIHG